MIWYLSLSLFLLNKAGLCMASSPQAVSSIYRVVHDATFWRGTRWHLCEALGEVSPKMLF